MSRIIFALAAATLLAGALSSPVAAEGRSAYDRNAWRQSLSSPHALPAPAAGIVEGRNAAVRPAMQAPSAPGVEPYILRQIAKDRRGGR